MPVQAAIVIAIALVFALVVFSRQARAWWRYRGQRVIACPETQKPVGVSLDARHAAASAALGRPELRLASCTRWPERGDCGQPCLAEIASAPEDCLVRNILVNWYQGKSCALCGKAFGLIEWNAAKPALLLPNGVTEVWSEAKPEELHEVLASAKPVCFACHTASALVHQHPELVTDRSARTPGA